MIHTGQLRHAPALAPRTVCGVAARALDPIGKSTALNDLFHIVQLGERGRATVRATTRTEGGAPDSERSFGPV